MDGATKRETHDSPVDGRKMMNAHLGMLKPLFQVASELLAVSAGVEFLWRSSSMQNLLDKSSALFSGRITKAFDRVVGNS